MIDNLTEAIAHAREVAGNVKEIASTIPVEDEYCKGKLDEYLECIAKQEQLADWLTELAERREADRWISVKERLPEDYTKVLITNEYGIVTCITWNTWYQNEYEHAKKEYKAIAWKPIPKSYESEEK